MRGCSPAPQERTVNGDDGDFRGHGPESRWNKDTARLAQVLGFPEPGEGQWGAPRDRGLVPSHSLCCLLSPLSPRRKERLDLLKATVVPECLVLGGGRGVCIDVKVGAVQGPTGRASATRPFETEVTQLPGSPAPKTFPVFVGRSLTHGATPGKLGFSGLENRAGVLLLVSRRHGEGKMRQDRKEPGSSGIKSVGESNISVQVHTVEINQVLGPSYGYEPC